MALTHTISVDAMGGDHGPAAVIAGVDAAVRRQPGLRFLLHGRGQEIEAALARYSRARAASEIRDAETFVAMDDKPSEALRRARGTSMWNAIHAVKDGEAEVAMSAGNTGALMAISKVILRMKQGVHRPAIVASWPTPRGFSTVLDVGANVECTPTQLVEFAIMGEAFARAVHRIERPTVGLLNIGAEELKGNAMVQEAASLLRTAHLDLDYHGYVEGDGISMGVVDVVVTDGFTGNVALKTAEGAARLVGRFVKEEFTSTWRNRISAFLSHDALKGLRARMDPRSVNGGVLLGLNGIVVKSHGGADAEGFANALRVAADMAESNFLTEIETNLRRLARVSNAAPGQAAE